MQGRRCLLAPVHGCETEDDRQGEEGRHQTDLPSRRLKLHKLSWLPKADQELALAHQKYWYVAKYGLDGLAIGVTAGGKLGQWLFEVHSAGDFSLNNFFNLIRCLCDAPDYAGRRKLVDVRHTARVAREAYMTDLLGCKPSFMVLQDALKEAGMDADAGEIDVFFANTMACKEAGRRMGYKNEAEED